MHTRRVWLALSMLGALGVRPCSATATESAAAVYDALFVYLNQYLSPDRVLYVWESPLNPSSTLSPAALKAPGLLLPVPMLLRDAVQSSNTRIFSNAEYLAVFSEQRGCMAAWKEFHLRYPEAQALVRLSGVAFDKLESRAVALVEVGTGCFGATVSKAEFFRNGDGWKLDCLTQISIS